MAKPNERAKHCPKGAGCGRVGAGWKVPRSPRTGTAGRTRSSPECTGHIERRRRSTGGHGEASGGSAALELPGGAPCTAGREAPGLLALRVAAETPLPPPGSFRLGTPGARNAGSSGRSSVIRTALTLATPGAAGGAREVLCTSNVSYRGSFMGEGCRDHRGINDTLLPKCVTPGNHL